MAVAVADTAAAADGTATKSGFHKNRGRLRQDPEASIVDPDGQRFRASGFNDTLSRGASLSIPAAAALVLSCVLEASERQRWVVTV